MNRKCEEGKESGDPHGIGDDFESAIEVLQEIDLEGILRNASDLGYTSIAQSLFKAARKAEDEGKHLHSKVLMLLDKVCWTHIPLSRAFSPFDEAPVTVKKPSAVQSQFTDVEIEFLKEITRSVNNSFLRGKLAHLVWNCLDSCEIEFALLAIDSYMRLPLEADTWFNDGQECLLRAIDLCRNIGKVAKDSLAQIESSLITALESATTERGFYGYLLAETLMSGKSSKDLSTIVAAKLESMAGQFENAGNFHAAGRHYHASSECFNLFGDKEKNHDMIVSEAEMFEKEADDRVNSADPSYRLAAGFLENAVQIYRRIPRIYRDRQNVDQRIQELRLRISEYNSRAMGEMKSVSIPGVDISEIIEQARNSVAGKPRLEALKAFADLHRVDVSDLRELALKNLSSFQFRRLFPTVHLSDDGRVVAKTHGLSGDVSLEKDESAIRAEMNEFAYGINVRIAVQAKLLPALDLLNLEHDLDETDFIDIARHSPIVPKNREVLFGKALAYGFKQDYMTSIHLLTPQIEHLVRFHLESAGVITTHLDQEGIETKNSLGTLIYLDEAEELFGENLTYEIRALFCDPIGPNLRNNVAHGLLDDQQCFTYDSVYAWWLAFKLAFNTFWNTLPPGRDSVNK